MLDVELLNSLRLGTELPLSNIYDNKSSIYFVSLLSIFSDHEPRSLSPIEGTLKWFLQDGSSFLLLVLNGMQLFLRLLKSGFGMLDIFFIGLHFHGLLLFLTSEIRQCFRHCSSCRHVRHGTGSWFVGGWCAGKVFKIL